MWSFNLIGSLGLFLLGMWLMTEGLKLAGGQALQTLLGRWTSSRLRGLAAGVLVTALVQSSSAVTVATIGFVNAGLMTFQQSVWVIFGSNVGTTLTAWLVTLFGFSVDIEAFTFPLLGFGAFLRVFSPWKRGQALGMALAGFGLLFMGIDALQESFAGVAERFDVETFTGIGIGGTLLGLVIGLFLTMITQSSSAAIALILTAVAGGLVELNVAVAAVIGANIGTTTTALLATIGATPNARRLASAHVVFNLLTGVVALALIPVFLLLTANVVDPESTASLTLMLAIFHTSFNLLGVLLMLPVEPRLSAWLLQKFEKSRAERPAASTLDKNVAAVPDLALRALAIEIGELQKETGSLSLQQLIRGAFRQETTEGRTEGRTVGKAEEKAEGAGGPSLDGFRQQLEGIDQFIALISQADLTRNLSVRLTAGFSAAHYLRNSFDTLSRIAEQQPSAEKMDPRVLALLDDWLMRVSQFAREIVHTDSTYQATHWSELLGMYQQFKKEVLASAISNGVDMDSVEVALLLGSLSRRYVEQMLQVKESFELLNTPLEREPGSQQQASGTTDGSESPVAPAAQDQTPATQPVLNPDGSSRH